MEELSKRMRRIISVPDPFQYVIESRGSSGSPTYHPTKCPKGVINLTSSQNRLCGDLMLQQVQKLDLSGYDAATLLQYQDAWGVPELRRASADFLKDFVKAPQDLDPEKIRYVNGLTALVDILLYTLCEEGDTILSPSPMFVGVVTISSARANVHVHPIHLSSKRGEQGEELFELTVEHLERGYAEAVKQGRKVKVLMLINPQNPLGIVYTKQQLLSYLEFGKRHSLHVILDEIFLCSVYDGAPSSVLSLREEEIPDLERTHIMWSFSKDFSFNGSHCGMLYSWNEHVLNAVSLMTDYHITSSLIQRCLTQILLNKEWLHDVYFKTCHKRLKEARDVTMETLDELGVTYVKPVAGFYIWVNFNKFLGASTYADEKSFCKHLKSCDVTILPSAGFYGNEFGWFRVLFSVPLPELREGLRRIKEGCRSYQAEDSFEDASVGVSGGVSGGISASGSGEESLESLLRSLHHSIKNSDWLKENTADKWCKENPEVAEAWMKELEKNSTS